MCGRECGIGGTCADGACDPIVGVSMHRYHACAWRSGGGVLCWGDGSRGQLGVPGLASSPGPVVSTAVRDAAQVCVGLSYTCARLRTGEVACWGTASAGQRGGGVEPGEIRHPEAALIPGLSDAVEIGCGYTLACARRASGRVMCWGGGAAAQFGSDERGPLPREVPGMSDVAQLALYPETDEIHAVTTDGRLLTLGSTIAGGSSWASVSDVSAHFPSRVDRVIPGGSLNGCARLTTGALHCWGPNAPWTDEVPPHLSAIPRAIGMTHWTGTSAHALAHVRTMCALTADGRVTCTGACNGEGLRGDGCLTETAQGTFATGIDDAVSLAATNSSFCAVRMRGDLMCWGYGPLGNGAELSAVPVRVVSD